MELARIAGLVLDPWQEWWVTEALAEDSFGRWAAREAALVVPRQNGKGSCLEALQLAGMFLVGDTLQVHSAHEFKTCYEHFLRITSLIEGCPDLDRQVQRIRRGAGEQAVELKTGERLRFVARSAGSGRGLTADRVYLDEAYALLHAIMGALIPTLSAVPNPQIVYASSAPRDESDVLHALRRRGHEKSGKRLLYAEWCGDPNAERSDRQDWVRANPSLGIRISVEAIETELEAMSPEEFDRERRGIPSSKDASGASGIDPAKWSSLANPFEMRGRAALAVDVAPDNKSASIIAAQIVDGVCWVDVVERREGVAWVLNALSALKPLMASLVFDGSGPTVAIGEDLVRMFRATEFSAGETMHAAMTFASQVESDGVRHQGNASLQAAVIGAVRRFAGDRWRWGRASSTVDITPLVAASLAAATASRRPPATPRFQFD